MNSKKKTVKTFVSVIAVVALSLIFSLLESNSYNSNTPNFRTSSYSANNVSAVSQTTSSTPATSTSTSVSSSVKETSSLGSNQLNSNVKSDNKKKKFVGPLLYQGSNVRATYNQVKEGQTLFDESCASCHGAQASGSDRAPNLVGLGPATVQFWVSTGRMPLSNPIIQPIRKPVKFTQAQILDIVSYVSSLAPGGVLIPNIKGYNSSSIANGASLFDINCAGCHTITGAGDALASGAYAPSLHQATPEQVAEAIRTGPANMPRFNPGVLTNSQVNSLVKYVTQGIQKPDNAGGWDMGGIGPVAEGFIGLLIGVGLLMLGAFWVGDRQ
jgi:ubiquinol-cytochrome c reductase cytochrome c subunit